MWQSQVEIKHYSDQFLSTFFDVHVLVTMSWNLPERSKLACSNSYICAVSKPTLGLHVQSIALGELIELS